MLIRAGSAAMSPIPKGSFQFEEFAGQERDQESAFCWTFSGLYAVRWVSLSLWTSHVTSKSLTVKSKLQYLPLTFSEGIKIKYVISG